MCWSKDEFKSWKDIFQETKVGNECSFTAERGNLEKLMLIFAKLTKTQISSEYVIQEKINDINDWKLAEKNQSDTSKEISEIIMWFSLWYTEFKD